VPSYLVTTTADSGNGSLRQGITSGATAIVFNIPTTDCGYNSGNGTFTINATAGYSITKAVVIDGTIAPLACSAAAPTL
jgi:hypothetical protein